MVVERRADKPLHEASPLGALSVKAAVVEALPQPLRVAAALGVAALATLVGRIPARCASLSISLSGSDTERAASR
jgi:hypothetical protein